MIGNKRREEPVIIVESADRDFASRLASALAAHGLKVSEASSAVVTGTQVVRVLDDPSAACISATDPTIVLKSDVSEEFLLAAMERGAAAVLRKPLSTTCLALVIRMLAARAVEVKSLEARAARLTDAMDTNQAINTVIGIMMERHRITASEAHERFRRYARSERVKLRAIADEILSNVESSNQVLHKIVRTPVAGLGAPGDEAG